MPVPSLPFSFTPGPIISSTQVNQNFATIYSWANGGVDFSNVGTAGFYPSQLKPTTLAQGTIGGTAAVTFPIAPVGPNGGTFLDTSSAAQTKIGPLAVNGLLSAANFQGGFGQFGGSSLAPSLSGDVSLARNTTQGYTTWGGSVSSATLDYNVTTAGCFTMSVPIKATSFNGSGAGLTAGTVPNGALVTTPLDVSSTAQTKAGPLSATTLGWNGGTLATVGGNQVAIFINPAMTAGGYISNAANSAPNATWTDAGAWTFRSSVTAGGAITPGVAGTVGTSAIYSGTGAPTLIAPSGSLYLRYDGSPGSRLYVNISTASSSSNAWTAFA